MADRREEMEAERQREAEAALKRVERDAETVGTSSAARIAKKADDHFSGADAGNDDWAEVWGRHIGRIGGLIFVLWLVFYLVTTYVIPR